MIEWVVTSLKDSQFFNDWSLPQSKTRNKRSEEHTSELQSLV